MTKQEFSAIQPTLPLQPGIYKYFDAAKKLIYVGKAKSIRKRVSSYFSKNITGYKTLELVSRIRSIEFTIVNNEHDALLLENSLIKEHQPLFNIELKDDKSYPFIVVKNEPFPRVFFTRKRIKDGSQYFGPFTSVGKVRELLELVRQNIPLRTCTLNLSQKNIKAKKFKVCLEYHLGNCKGPCEGFETEEDYNESLEQIKKILRGQVSAVLRSFKDQQKVFVQNLEFEKAAFLQTKIEHLENYVAKSQVTNTKIASADVFSILEEGDTAYVSYISVADGSIFQTKVLKLNKKLDETKEEVLALAIADIRQTFGSTAAEIILPFEIEYEEESVSILVPKGGDKKQMLDLATKNADYFKAELKAKKVLHLENKSASDTEKVLRELQVQLSLPELPVHIECFDNSNFQGSFPVAAMVCFRNGLPAKTDYLRFHIKTVEGINDFASMEEIVMRRYKRLADDEQPLPQLVIIDGGKGQLSAAMKSIDALNLRGKMAVVGLAKNFEEIFFPGDTESIRLRWDSDALKLIRRIRDEVHRFGITFHRNTRSKGTFKNELEGIEGIGPKTIAALLKNFKSVKKIKEASEKEIAAIIGGQKTKLLLQYLQSLGIK